MQKLVSQDTSLESISPTLYEQLLRVQISKAQKETEGLTVFLNFWDLLHKASTLVKSTQGVPNIDKYYMSLLA